MSRGKMVEITCKCGCDRKRMVRVADVRRGWGKFYNKSCKARWQERQTGQYADYIHRISYRDSTRRRSVDIENTFHPHDPYTLGQE